MVYLTTVTFKTRAVACSFDSIEWNRRRVQVMNAHIPQRRAARREREQDSLKVARFEKTKINTFIIWWCPCPLNGYILHINIIICTYFASTPMSPTLSIRPYLDTVIEWTRGRMESSHWLRLMLWPPEVMFRPDRAEFTTSRRTKKDLSHNFLCGSRSRNCSLSFESKHRNKSVLLRCANRTSWYVPCGHP